MNYSPIAIQNNPDNQMVTGSMLINIDAKLTSSYPGTGTTVFNLANNNGSNNGTIVATTTYTSSNVSNWQYGNTSGYISFPSGTNGADSDSYTWGGWYKINNADKDIFLNSRGADGSGSGWNLSVYTNNTTKKLIVGVVKTSGGTALISVTQTDTYTVGQWYHIYAVWAPGKNIILYINGVMNNIFATTQTGLRSSTVGWFTGKQNALYNSSNNSDFQVYNRALTANEVRNNFNAECELFGYNKVSGNISTGGLQLYLDAGVTASYAGTGTAWNDLSGNGNNLTLVNGPAYSSSNGGFFLFDGTNDYVSNYTYGTTFSANEFTYQAVLNYSGKTAYNNIFDTYNSVNPMMWIDASNRLELNQAALVSALSYNTQNIMVTFVQQNANPGLQLYINDTLIGTVTTAQGTISNSRFNFFRRETAGQYFKGRAYNVLIYNRVLSATDIANNYNQFKTRFPI